MKTTEVGKNLIEDFLREGKNVIFNPLGNSMLPTISPGTSIKIVPCDIDHLHPGDVILYFREMNNEKKFFLHRIIDKVNIDSQLKFMCKGDNNKHYDLPVYPACILGKTENTFSLSKNDWKPTFFIKQKKYILPKLHLNETAQHILELLEGQRKSIRLEADFYEQALSENHTMWGVGPMILKASGNDLHVVNVAGSLQNKWLKESEQQLVVNTIINQNLKEICSELNERKIRYVVVKGAVLANTVYADYYLRPMNDIDFVIEKKDLVTIKSVMEKLGYEEDVSDQPSHRLRKYKTEITYKKGEISVEFHWEVSSFGCYKKLRTSILLEKYDTFILDGIKINSMTPENHILFMCIHLMKHLNGLRLMWFYDVIAVIRKYNIDWKYIYKIASETGTLYPLKIILDPIQKIIVDAPGFSYIIGKIENYHPEHFEMIFIDYSINGRHEKFTYLEFLSQETIWQKIGYLWAVLFPGKEVLRNKYPNAPESLLFLKYFNRFFEIIFRLFRIIK